jgi:hypothetical protein
VTPEKTGVLLSSSIYNLNRRLTMAKKLYSSLVSMFERKKLSRDDMLTWAKTEYGRDWQYAYDYIKRTGHGPRMGVYY